MAKDRRKKRTSKSRKSSGPDGWDADRVRSALVAYMQDNADYVIFHDEVKETIGFKSDEFRWKLKARDRGEYEIKAGLYLHMPSDACLGVAMDMVESSIEGMQLEAVSGYPTMEREEYEYAAKVVEEYCCKGPWGLKMRLASRVTFKHLVIAKYSAGDLHRSLAELGLDAVEAVVMQRISSGIPAVPDAAQRLHLIITASPFVVDHVTMLRREHQARLKALAEVS